MYILFDNVVLLRRIRDEQLLLDACLLKLVRKDIAF